MEHFIAELMDKSNDARELAEAKARLADIAYGAKVHFEGRSCLTKDFGFREIYRVASTPL